MAMQPTPAPRARLTKQAEACSEEMHKRPPPVPPKKIGWQPLPGMVRAISLPESSGKEEFSVQRNNVEDGIGSMSLQCTDQALYDNVRKLGHQEKNAARRVLLTQQSWHGDFQQPLNSEPIYATVIPTKNNSQCRQDSQDSIAIMNWWNSAKPWMELESSGMERGDEKSFTQKAENLRKALYVYDHLLSERGANLQGHIIELEEVANDINKVHKGVKIAGITGGAAGAVGVAAAVGGVILAPLTGGASLAVTAVGVGVAAAGGVTGASAAITNKVHTNMDRKKVETILKEHCSQIEEIERCVKFITTYIESMRKYNLSTLRGVDWKSVKVARMAHKVGDSVGTIGTVNKSSGMIQGFALGLDMYFNQEDSKQLKKGSEAKFAKKIRKLAKQMQTSLDELMKFKTVLGSEEI